MAVDMDAIEAYAASQEGGAEAPVEAPPTGGEPPAPAATSEGAAPVSAPQVDDEKISSELRRARDEAAKYRTRARRFEEAFEGYDDTEVSQALELYQLLQKDPKAAHQRFQAVAGNLEQYLREQGMWEEADAVAKAADTGLSRADVEKLMEEREQRAARDRAVQSIISDAAKLGYEEGTWQQGALLFIASKSTNGDLNKAHAALEEFKAGLREEGKQAYLASLEGGGNYPPVSSGGGPGAPAATGGHAPNANPSPAQAAREYLRAAGFNFKE